MANVLITGCSSGFGLLSALRFARDGDTVFATMRNTAKAGELERIRDAEKLDIRILQLDVQDDASVQRAVRDALAQTGGIDVLVNNAGVELRSPVELAADDEVQWQFDTNVFGMLRVVRAVAPSMRERRSGTIVNLSSLAGVVSRPYGGWYAASKHAVEAISEALHYELHPFNIRVAIIEPGVFITGFQASIRDARAFTPDSPYYELSQRFDVALGKLNPEGTVADPEDVAKAIFDAVRTGQPKLRHLVGGDAQLVAGVRKQTDFEGFEQAMRQTLDWHD